MNEKPSSLSLDLEALATELMAAHWGGGTVVPPSTRDPGFDLTAAYQVERELARCRRRDGHAAIGRKVGFANKAVWRALKLDTLVWAHMYDDTVQFAPRDRPASLSIGHRHSPKIEPEIVFKLRKPLTAAAGADASAALDAVEWLALGFEIIDCVFPDWKFQPTDFVAAFGLHAALVIGEPQSVDAKSVTALVEQLPRFKVALLRDGALVDEGGGKNVLRSPALCLAELGSSIARQSDVDPLVAGELVSSGTLTTSQPVNVGETWTVADGLDLPPLTLEITR